MNVALRYIVEVMMMLNMYILFVVSILMEKQLLLVALLKLKQLITQNKTEITLMVSLLLIYPLIMLLFLLSLFVLLLHLTWWVVGILTSSINLNIYKMINLFLLDNYIEYYKYFFLNPLFDDYIDAKITYYEYYNSNEYITFWNLIKLYALNIEL